VPEAAFDPVVEVFDYAADCQLFSCSDGVIEDYNCVPGEITRQARVESMLAETPPALRLKRLRSELAARTGDGTAQDDMTVVLLECTRRIAATLAPPRMPAQWHFETTFGPADLRAIDVVSLLLEVIGTIPGAHFHRRQLGVIVAELFANALDHGVLGLPSVMKDDAQGFERYFVARAEALARLDHGSIAVHIESIWRDGRPQIELQFRDSGNGFSATAQKVTELARHGRGIALVRSLCRHVEYHGAGNDVRVSYLLDSPLPDAQRAAA
jgi:anti-sigma regulatory factor (Ser/Thr protein kinase)